MVGHVLGMPEALSWILSTKKQNQKTDNKKQTDFRTNAFAQANPSETGPGVVQKPKPTPSPKALTIQPGPGVPSGGQAPNLDSLPGLAFSKAELDLS